MYDLRKHCAGTYRVTLSERCFGQIQRNTNGEWMAEIRLIKTGDFVRYAGLWSTRRAAYEELKSIPAIDL